jgi:hypothetical protein
MSLNTDLAKKVNSMIGSEMGSSVDTGEFIKSMNSVMSTLEQSEQTIIKKKLKKSDMIKNLSKNQGMTTPIGKIYSMGKSENKEATSAGAAGGFTPALSGEMKEKWSQKYKDSIDCDNPKGFSQRAHCAGKKKSDNLKKVETKEATSSASAGSYVTTAAWAKSTKKKDWRGKSKTQIPGGSFVQVKKKCKKFPYCNQGDINALNITNEEKMNKIIKSLSKKHNISETVIKDILKKDYFKNK